MSIHYRYDALGRLVAAGTEGGQEIVYAYDDAGNQVSATVQAAAPVPSPSPAPAAPRVLTPASPVVPPPASAVPSAPTRVAAAPAAPPPAVQAPPPAAATPAGEKKSNRNLLILLGVIAVLLCCCLPALLSVLYVLAKNAGVLPAALGGTGWVPLLMFQAGWSLLSGVHNVI